LTEEPISPDALQRGLDVADSAMDGVQRFIPEIRKRAKLLRSYADEFDAFCTRLERLAERACEPLPKN